MKLDIFKKLTATILLFLIFPTFSATDYPTKGLAACENQVILPTSINPKSYHPSEFFIYSTDRTQKREFHLWRRRCDTGSNGEHEYEIVLSAYPNGTTAAIEGASSFNLRIVQDSKEKQKSFPLLGYLSEPESQVLFSSGNYPYIDARKTFTLLLCEGYCSSNNNIASLYSNDISSYNLDQLVITGPWYDPAYNGMGFNTIQMSNGFFMYFYGYKGNEDGQAQWLISAAGPQTVIRGETFTVDVYSGNLGNGASFTQKPSSEAGVTKWGTAEVTFNNCSTGVIKLDGKDGSLTHNVVKLGVVADLECQ